MPPIPRPGPCPQHRQAAAPGAPHCACTIQGSLLHRWGRGGWNCCSGEEGQDVALLVQRPVPTQSRDQGQWGWGRPHGGPGGLGCVWGGSRLSLLARGEPGTVARAGRREHPGRGLLHPRLDGHLIFPRFLQRKQTARGWTLTGAVLCLPPSILGDPGGTSHGQPQGSTSHPIRAPR